MDAVELKNQPSKSKDQSAGVTISREFVEAVRAQLSTRVWIALWILREVTKMPDPARAGRWLASRVELAIRNTPAGANLSDEMLVQICAVVVDALLGPREPGGTVLVPLEREEAAETGTDPP